VGKKTENGRREKKTEKLTKEKIKLTSLHGAEIFLGSL
jgi:hypothetical protein